MSEQWMKDGRLDPEALVPALRSFLGLVIRATGLEVRAEVRARAGEDAAGTEAPDITVDFHGRDADLLLERRA
ncbi:MAG: hypothetical protein ACE10I_07840, partial [Candidatus Acidiferrales bacterium]